MSEEKFEIGLRDVFNEVKNIGGQLSAYIQVQDPKIAVIEHRLTEAETDIKDIHASNHEAEQHRHEERRHRAVVRWGVVGGALCGLLSLIGSSIAIFH